MQCGWPQGGRGCLGPPAHWLCCQWLQPHRCKAQWAWGWHRVPSLILRASPVSVTFQAQQKAISETLQLATATLYAATLLIVLWIGHCWCSTDWGPCPAQESHPDALGPCCSHTQHKHYFTQPNFNASCLWSINAMVTKCMNKHSSQMSAKLMEASAVSSSHHPGNGKFSTCYI